MKMKINLEPNLKLKTSGLRNLKVIKNSDNQKEPPKKRKISKQYILFYGIGILLAVGLIIMVILLVNNLYKKSENIQNKEFNLGPLESEPGYEFSSKIKDLRRFTIYENNTEENNRDGTNLSNIIIRNTTYDLIIISEEEAKEEYKNLYNKTYLAAVAIVRECINTENKTCVPHKFVDLIDQNIPNLKAIDEIEDLKDIPIYLCLFNFTNNNIILSMLCPKSLSEFKIKTILSDLHLFKPTSIKRVNKKKRNITIIQKLNGKNKLIMEKYGGSCKFGNQLNSLCSRDMNITKDLEDNIISVNEENTAKVVKNKNNSFIKNKVTKLKDITKETKNLSSEKYLNILNIILSKLKRYLKLKEYLSFEDFKEIYKENKGGIITNITKRNLNEASPTNFSINYGNYGNLFTYSNADGLTYEINLLNSNPFAPFENEYLEARIEININGNKYLLDNIKCFNDIYPIIMELMRINKASKSLANKLYFQIKQNFNIINEVIINNITSLNNLIIYKDLGEIMNLTLLPFNIINESNILKNELEKILIGIERGKLKNDIDILNNNIKYYINNTQLTIKKIYNNLEELVVLLNLPKSKYTEIVAYYLNNTFSPYNKAIEDAKKIFDSYYKNEYNIIISQIDLELDFFKKKSFNTLNKYTNLIDNLKENIENKNNPIENAKDIDYKNIISNFENSNNLIKEIIEQINFKLKNGVILEDSGYFVSKDQINSNKNIYNKTISDLIILTQKLNNNEFIDKEFNEIMVKYKKNINNAINYIYQLIDEEFLMKEKNFNENLIKEKNKISIDITYLGIDISNKIKNENNYYLPKVKKNIATFLQENKDYLNQLNIELSIILSEESLEKISKSYDIAFQSCLNKIKSDLQNNKLLINNYYNNLVDIMQNNTKIFELINSLDENNLMNLESLENMLAFKSISKAYLTKNNIYQSNLEYLRYYFDEQLFFDFLFLYKNITLKIKELLQSIKDTKITDEYLELSELSFIEKNIKIKDVLNKRLNKFFSDDLFNKKYAEKLNIYKASQILEIENLYKFIEDKNNILKNYNISNDYSNDFCINFYENKIYSGLSPNLYTDSLSRDYCYPLPINSDNHNKLVQSSIYFDENLSKFSNQFNEFYLLLKNKIDSYINKINELKKIFELMEKQDINQNITFDYLSQIQEYILSLIQQYSTKIISYSFDYYQNETKIKTIKILNESSIKWNNIFDLFKEDIDKILKSKGFKYSVNELFIIASIYEDIISHNISNNIYDTIINHQKIEFSNEISSFYNYLLKLVNSIYQYIIKNIPRNIYGFNNILNKRKIEIHDVFTALINKIIESKNFSLNIKEQKSILQIEDNDFFKINFYLKKNIEENNISLKNKVNNIKEIIGNKNIDELSFVSSLYLENSQNGKQINEYYEIINNEQFILFEYTDLINIINENWILNGADFINALNAELINSNKEISNDFLNIKESYIIKLEKIITKYFTKENIISKINNLYENKFKELNEEEINKIKNNINEITIKIKQALSNEANKLKTIAVSYNNNFSKINNTIKEYEQKFLKQLHKILFIELDDFHKNMINKVYFNYVEKYLNQYIKEAKKVTLNFKAYKTLNLTYNLREIIDNIIEDLVYEYKNIIKKQIDYKYEEYQTKLLKEINLNKTFNEIEKEYNWNLFKILKKVAIYSEEDSEYLPYDLNDDIKNNINSEIDIKINNIKQIVLVDNGNNHTINIDQWEILNFSNINKNISEIKSTFEEFIHTQILNEKIIINNFLKNFLKSNFNLLLKNFLLTLGNEFFKRIIQYNDNMKIKNLFNKIQNSLSETLNYYLSLYDLSKIKALPKELKIKLLELNNIDNIIKNKNEQILKILKTKTKKFIEKVQKFIIKKYILFFNEDSSINLYYNENINQIINENLNEIIPDIEINCQDLLFGYSKENFEEPYIEILNDKTNNIIKIINIQKEILKIKYDNLFVLDSEKTFEEINIKINNGLEAVKEYNNLSNNFKLSNELIDNLNNYINNTIITTFNGLDNILSGASKKQIQLIDKYYNNLINYNTTKSLSNNINSTIVNNFENLRIAIDSYGLSDYEEKLEKEIYKIILSNKEDEKKNDIPIHEIFNSIFKYIEQVKLSIETFDIFEEFDDKISLYIKNLNSSYREMEINIINKKYIDYYIPILEDKILKIKDITLDYYISMNETFYTVKNYINKEINNLINLLNKCNNITYITIINKYDMISKKTESFNIQVKEMNFEDQDYKNIYYLNNDSYIIKNEFLNLNKKGKINFWIKKDEDKISNLMLTLSIINQINPRLMFLSIEKNYGNCGKYVENLEINFNNVNLTTITYLNLNASYMEYNIFTDFDDFIVRKEIYVIEDKENIKCVQIRDIPICINLDCNDEMMKIISRKDMIYPKKYLVLKNLVDLK